MCLHSSRHPRTEHIPLQEALGSETPQLIDFILNPFLDYVLIDLVTGSLDFQKLKINVKKKRLLKLARSVHNRLER